MASAPLLTLRYASFEDVAQDLDMVIQSSSQDEWSWEGSSEQDEARWADFVGDPTGADTSSAKVVGLSGRIMVTKGIALSFSLLSQAQHDQNSPVEAAIEMSAPTLPSESVSQIKDALVDRAKQWADEGVESLYFFDLLTTAQTLLADMPNLTSSPTSAATTNNNDDTSTAFAGNFDTIPKDVSLSRALFWSHHLKAPSKLKDFHNWCPELRIWGIVRVGWPGYLCFEGESSAVDEMVRRVKGLQWHAIQLRVQHSRTYTATKGARGGDVLDQALLSCALARATQTTER